VVKGQILANPALRSNFDACLNLYQDFITQAAQSGNPTFTVASTGSKREGYKGKSNSWKGKGGAKKRPRDNGDDDSSDVEDGYYKPQEYAKLSGKKKTKLASMRDSRGGGKRKNPRGNAMKDMSRQIAALEAKFKEQYGDESKDTSKEEVTNRTHSALTCQKRK
jgi:hypothetical protein